MTATKKLFIAAVLLTAGFGVARLMGRPDAPWLAPHASATSLPATKNTTVAQPVARVSPGASMANGARLVPDFSADSPYRVDSEGSSSKSAPNPQSNLNVGVVVATPPPFVANSDYQRPHNKLEPRAKLRDEAPRPLDFESRGTATMYTPISLASRGSEAAPTSEPRSAAVDWRASGLTPADFVQNATNRATINASYSQPVDTATSLTTLAPPPWPERDEANGPRTHVVVDGDSLERLAGRYLDDSSRGNEIYEANRELLASPDLLPIGAELVIPIRQDRATFNDSLPQSALAKDASLRAATNDGMVRVRPVPSAANVLPRAQLLPPVRAE